MSSALVRDPHSDHLITPDVLERGLLVGGNSVPASSGRLADDISPWDGEIYARVAAGTPEDITRAADAAEAAFPSWSKMGAFERREIFLRAADVMAQRREEAIAALAGETGASRVFSEFNVAFCIQVLREAAAAITRPMGELLPTSIPGAYSMAQRIPFGVVGAISPWNAPLVLGMRSIAVPLAVGNTVVMKPSEDAPITCGLLLADVLAEAGLPAGVLNVVTNDLADAGDVVAALIADPRVRMVNFTGSTNVGRIIGVQAAKQLKPAVLELGGKNPLLILEDADLDLAVDAAVFGAFLNSGQICMCTDRITSTTAWPRRSSRGTWSGSRRWPPATPPIPPRSSGPSSTPVLPSVSRRSSTTPPPREPPCSPATERSRGRTEPSSGRSCSPA